MGMAEVSCWPESHRAEANFSSSPKMLCLSAGFFGRSFDDEIGGLDRAFQIGMARHARHGAPASVFKQIANLGNAFGQGFQRGGHRIMHPHRMARRGKQIGDAVAHEPGADNGDVFLISSVIGFVASLVITPRSETSSGRVAAVDIHDLPGAEIGSRRQKIDRHAHQIFHLTQTLQRNARERTRPSWPGPLRYRPTSIR